MLRHILLCVLSVVLLTSWLPAHAQLHVHADDEAHSHASIAEQESADVLAVDTGHEAAEPVAEAACCHGDSTACCGGSHCNGLVFVMPHTPHLASEMSLPELTPQTFHITPSRLDRPPRA